MGVAGQRLLTICLLVTDWWISRSYVVSFLGVPSTVTTQMSVDWVWTTLPTFRPVVGRTGIGDGIFPRALFRVPDIYCGFERHSKKARIRRDLNRFLRYPWIMSRNHAYDLSNLDLEGHVIRPRDDIGKSWEIHLPESYIGDIEFWPISNQYEANLRKHRFLSS